MNPAYIVIFVFLLAMIAFVTEIIPANLTIMIAVCVLVLTRVIEPAAAISGFAGSTIIMIIGMTVIGKALFKTGYCQSIINRTLKYVKSERQMMLVVFLLTAVLSTCMSDTACVTILIPFIFQIAADAKYSQSRLVFSSFLGSIAGGRLTLIGDSSLHLMVAEKIEELGGTFGFFETAKIGIPLLVVWVVWIYFLGDRRIPDRPYERSSEFSSSEIDVSMPQWRRVSIVVIFLATVIAIMLTSVHGFPAYMCSIFGAVLVCCLGTYKKGEIFGCVNWNLVILFGGCTPIAGAMTSSGAADMIANWMVKLIGSNPNPYIICTVIFLFVVILTQFMVNVTLVMLFIPIIVSMAELISVNPITLIFVLVCAGKMSTLSPLSCGMAQLAYNSTGLKFRDFFTSAIGLTLISCVICIFMIPMIWPF